LPRYFSKAPAIYQIEILNTRGFKEYTGTAGETAFIIKQDNIGTAPQEHIHVLFLLPPRCGMNGKKARLGGGYGLALFQLIFHKLKRGSAVDGKV
jgi:hypothetical protein